jgi:predicted ATP-grasp superfamily ATP-dependent carboligase/GNAT superfamily N-acetyltransferase
MTDKKNDDVQIVELRSEHAEEVARLHIHGISAGFISSLGIPFVKALYESIATSEYGFGFVAIQDDEVVGFSSFTTNLGRLYKSVISRHWYKFAFTLAIRAFHFKTLKRIIETLIYPNRVKDMNLPSAEFLSMVVAEEGRGKGLATRLMKAGFSRCSDQGIERIKILAAVHINAINRMYEKFKYDLVGQIENHGNVSNVYVTYTDDQKRQEAIDAGINLKDDILATEENYPVFITYGWCRSSYSAVRSLGSRGIEVHVGDASRLAMSRYSRYCKSFTELPDFFVEPKEYFEAVCQALRKTGAKVLLPGHEDVKIFSKYRDRLPKGVYLAVPEMDSYNIAEDKLSIVEIARETGCPTAETHQIFSKEQLEEKAETINYPLIVKARAGNSAKGVRIAKNKKELFTNFDELVDAFELDKDRWPILQKFLPGEAVGVCVVYDHGKCVVSFAEKYLRCKNPNRFGTSTLREVFKNEELINHAIGIMDKLNWHGVAHMDFVADKDGGFKLIEINPRLWGALSLAIHSGIDFPYIWYLLALGKKCSDSKFNIKSMRSRWIVGDAMAFVGLLKALELLESIKVFKPELGCVHDDFSFGDPLPFVFEIIDYLTKFVKAGFSTNPVTENMIH